MASRGGGRRGGLHRGEPRPVQRQGRGDPSFIQGGGGRGPYYGGGRGDPWSYQQPGDPIHPRVPYQQGSGGGGRGRGGGDAPREPYPALRHAPPAVDPSSSDQPVTTALKVLSISETPASASGTTVTTPVPDAQSTVPPASSKAERFPVRPCRGSLGRKVTIRANHFLVEFTSNREIRHYDVLIDPEIASRTINRVLIEQLIHKFASEFEGKRPAYDGRKNLYTVGELPFVAREFKKITLPKLPESEGSSSKSVEKVYSIKISAASRPNLHHLVQFIRGQQMDCPQDTIQALDVVLRVKPSTNHTLVGRSFFSDDGRSDIGAGMECWRGYYQSLRPTQMGLSLNIDISATSFYKSILVTEFVEELLELKNDIFQHNPRQMDLIRVKNSLKGIRVEVIHMKEKTRRYKIKNITTIRLEGLKFKDESGNMISVVEYFMKTYGFPLRLLHWPCLQAGSDSRPTFLPMEVCKIIHGQRYLKKLTSSQVTNMLRVTCNHPQERENEIHQLVLKNEYHNDVFAKAFGMDITPNLATFEARVLEPPWLKYHEDGRYQNLKPKLGQWNMTDTRLVNGGSVHSWACIDFTGLRLNQVNLFLDTLAKTCNRIGMTFNPNPILQVRQFKQFCPDKLEAVLRHVYDSKNDLQLLLITLPDSSSLYGPIKRICETELGIVSQCCLSKHVVKNLVKYHENVCLKINVKVGGRNTVLADALLNQIPFVTDKATIIFGADVTHPAPGDDTQSSIAAVVASIDWPQVTMYRGLVSAQEHRKEIICDLYKEGGGMIREHLFNFYCANHKKPERIIFYRDGVSEGQFRTVLVEEIAAIKKACRSLEQNYSPTVTFIVVQKRHHTRLFPSTYKDLPNPKGNVLRNVLPGTVVDTTICHPTDFDFYLCSHAGAMGTSRPAHYYVLYDENGFTADGLQELTNKLCYTYARCTRSVSVVPPVYYAHLAAFRARYYSAGGDERAAGVARVGGPAVRPLPTITDNVKNVMFFC